MNYIFFIGGSGARAYTAFLHACAAGVVRADKVNVMLLDADTQNAACKNSISLFKSYKKHRQMLDGVRSSGMAFHCNVQMLQESVVSPISHENITHLAQVAEGNDKRERALKWFYTKEELSQNLSKGFYAHPNIGCVFFQNFDQNSHLNRCMDNIIHDLGEGVDTRVVIVGSVFGGTGAAGIPSVLKILKERCDAEKIPFKQLRCCGVLVTPYFEVVQTSASSKQVKSTLTISSDNFYGSTKAALPYYRFNDDFEKTYLVGQTTLDAVSNQYADGGEEQDNKPHIVEVIAAVAIKDFLESKSNEKQVYGKFINRDSEQITWDLLGADMCSLADMLRTQMVLETAIYPCSVNQPSVRSGYQWRIVYNIYSAVSQQQLEVMQEYGEFFFEWLYYIQNRYTKDYNELCADPVIKLCNPIVLDRLRDRVRARKNNGIGIPEYKSGGWRQYQEDFINLVETAEKIEYVVKKIGTLLSALGVLVKPAVGFNCAGLFLKLFSLLSTRITD